MKQNRSLATWIFFVIAIIGGAVAFFLRVLAGSPVGVGVALLTFVLAIAVFNGVQVAEQWREAVILRLGNFKALKGPGCSS